MDTRLLPAQWPGCGAELTRDGGEVGWGGHGHEGRREVLGLDALLGQAVHVGGVHVLVIVPAEPIEGDEQQLAEALRPGDGVAAGPAQQDGQQQNEGPGACHVSAPPTLSPPGPQPAPIFSLFYLWMSKVHVDNSAPAPLWTRTHLEPNEMAHL